jgi:archaellum component FlaC
MDQSIERIYKEMAERKQKMANITKEFKNIGKQNNKNDPDIFQIIEEKMNKLEMEITNLKNEIHQYCN